MLPRIKNKKNYVLSLTIFVSFSIVIVLLFAACSPNSQEPNENISNTGDENAENIPISFSQFLSTVNQKHKSATLFQHASEEFDGYTDDFYATLSLVSKEEAESLTVKREPNANISKTDAQKEIDLLFRLLKTYYACYDYFGGDLQFNEIKEKILTRINVYETLNIDKYRTIVAEAFSSIQDGHFSIQGPVHSFSKDFYIDGYYFYEDTLGYYTLKNKEKRYLSAINDDAVLRPLQLKGRFGITERPDRLKLKALTCQRKLGPSSSSK